VVEGDETVSVTLGSGTGYTIASPPPSATVTIHDDPPVISVDGSDTVEGSTTGGFTLIRTGGDLSSSLTVTYTVGGTATSGTDYTALSGTATFAAGSNVVDVPVEALTITGGTTVTLTIDDGGTDYTIDMDAGDSTINIDDQPVEVSVQELADATEGGASGTFRFTRSGDLSSSLVATYTVAGTAAAGTNYTALSGTVTFAASSDHTDVTLTPLDDLTVDPTLTVTVTLDTSDDYMLGNNSDTAFIWDGDGAPVYWISTGSTDWTTAANWSSGTVPTASDDVYFNGSGGTYYSNVSCTNAGYGLSTLAGLHMVGSYSGTVTLASALTIDTFVESSGTLSQNYLSAAKDLSVDKAFLWTGGTLNATDNGANVTIDGTVGAVGRIDPPDTGSIATASTLNVISGALLGILPGELDFTGGSGIYIAAEVKAFTGDNIKEMNLKTTKTDTKVEIATGGEL
jgi:hypothetical protein